ncbi:MAG TPA: hypothetical protein VH138_05230 [Vicinamibacterales bacterium]|jgi:hypothetical protein|nr:hypothetical protein [Vicinamibacterales bacterium]
MPRSHIALAAFFACSVLVPAATFAQDPDTPASGSDEASSPWLIVPVVSSNPKIGTSGGAMAAFVKRFDPESRVSLIGLMYQYTSTESSIGAAFARTSFGADHHRIVVIGAFGKINNDYQDYLGTGQPLQTRDDLRAVAARYLYRVGGDWFLGGHGAATNYQVFGADPEDDLVLETLGMRGFSSSALGVVIMHDSRDNDDMPVRGWYTNINNLAYREAFGGSESYDAYRADFKTFLRHAGRHVLAIRQFNWITHDAPAIAQATVVLRGYKLGQYLAPYMSSIEAEERLSFGRRWGATAFAGVAELYGQSVIPLARSSFPTFGVGLQFVVKPDKHMLANLEYAQGVEDNHGIYLKFGYGW